MYYVATFRSEGENLECLKPHTQLQITRFFSVMLTILSKIDD